MICKLSPGANLIKLNISCPSMIIFNSIFFDVALLSSRLLHCWCNTPERNILFSFFSDEISLIRLATELLVSRWYHHHCRRVLKKLPLHLVPVHAGEEVHPLVVRRARAIQLRVVLFNFVVSTATATEKRPTVISDKMPFGARENEIGGGGGVEGFDWDFFLKSLAN